MNPATLTEAKDLFLQIKKVSIKNRKSTVVVCPPFLFIESLRKFTAPKISLGAQDVFWELEGAYTGEISPLQLYESGARYVIVGHYERRTRITLNETDEVINKKLKASLKAGLKPILCVGESKRDEAGNFLHFIKRQLELDLAGVKKTDLKNLIIAYEPIWTVGRDAKRKALPEECREIVVFIKKVLADMFGRNAMEKVQIIYGGSVDSKNARDYLTTGSAQGLLVGRESLRPKEFNEILKSI